MSSTRRPEKWFLVQWNEGDSREVVSSRAVVNPANEALIGAEVTIARADGGQHAAKIIGSSRDRQLLEQQISPVKLFGEVGAGAGPSVKRDESLDFSASGSSWAPSDESASSDDEEVGNKRPKLERYSRSYTRNSSKILKPTHRVTAINAITNNRKRKHEQPKRKVEKANKNVANKKIIPDSTKQNNSLPSIVKPAMVTVCVDDIIGMRKTFLDLFSAIKEMKRSLTYKDFDETETNTLPLVKQEDINITAEVRNDNESMVSDKSQSEESNRSEDNVLITNKYENIDVNNTRVLSDQANNTKVSHQDEWVPIGSGKTLIHKDQFRKVNFKSYTIATRTLLLAAFPRRILATHSLTGKRSPAFQDKPAKMCLDPKIVSDVLIEITDRFGVKENLVRSIITTKCADECKMLKTRLQRKTLPCKKENLPPKAEEENDDSANQTC